MSTRIHPPIESFWQPRTGQKISQYGQVEVYGLKIVQLILPVNEHRLAPFAQAKKLSLDLYFSPTIASTVGCFITFFYVLLSFPLLIFPTKDLVPFYTHLFGVA